MSATSLVQLHAIELELLKRFVAICDENHIQYYIIGGTLLGAVRHGGFIPWDDDIDVAVPRDDYRRLIRVMRQTKDETVGMQYYRDDQDLYFYPAKIIHKQYRVRDARATSGFSHPWIDVLPLDGKPDSPIKSVIFRAKMDLYRAMLGFCYIDRLRNIRRSPLQLAMIQAAKLFRPGRWINPTSVKDKIDRLLSSNRIEDCTVIGTCMGAYYFHEFVPKAYFGGGSTVQFCGLKVSAPEQIDQYLTHMYGDYRKLPPKNQQKTAHVTAPERIQEFE